MGWWMKRWRPGKVGEASIVGALLLLIALVGGGSVAKPPHARGGVHAERRVAHLDDDRLRLHRVGAAGVDAALPRDYLSTFLKITTCWCSPSQS